MWAALRPGLTFAAALVCAFAEVAAAQAPDRQDGRRPAVLLLFGLRSTAPLVHDVAVGFKEIRTADGLGVDLHIEYLDLIDHSAKTYSDHVVALLRDKYEGHRIDVVVAVQSQTLRLVLDQRDRLFPGLPILFADIDRPTLESLHPPPDVTGSILKLDVQRTVSVALDLHPDARRVVMVCGWSPDDKEDEVIFRAMVKARAPGIQTISLSGLPLKDQLLKLSQLPPDSVVIFPNYRADSAGRSMVAADVARLVARASAAPVYGASRTWLGLGFVGGDLIDYEFIGRRLAEMASRILAGEKASSIPPEEATGHLEFDWRALRRWGISESRLPPGSQVLFREKTLWSEYRGRLLLGIGLILAQGALIATLLVERRSRMRAQAGLREAEQRYRTVSDFTHDWTYWQRPDGSFAYVSPSCVRATGHAAAEFERRPDLLQEVILDEDRPRWQKHPQEVRAARGPVAPLEFRIRSADGTVRWIEHVCSQVRGAEGSYLGVRASNRDITERKQSEQNLLLAFAEIDRLRERLEAENTYLREQVEPGPGFEGIVGKSDALRYVLSRVQQVAPTSSTVLLQGETGVGKELVAHALHSLGPRHQRPLIKLNCAALPPSLVESELFGHEKGAFTGAVALRKGRFELADGGTLFLDEIGDLPLEQQAKLLRVIQGGEFERVGGTTTLKTDIRLVAATHRRLDQEVRAGRFREDLWYRLNVFPITIPPLRQRRDDIPALVLHFVEKHCRNLGRPILQVSQAILRDFQARDWPGNVRELESVVERAVISSSGSTLRSGDEHAPPAAEASRASGAEADSTARASDVGDGAKTLADLERDHIVAILERTYWQLEGESGAAAVLGINPSTLRSRMRKHGIRRPGSRPPTSISTA